MKNAYGGEGDNGSDEKNFVEQLVQCLAVMKLMLCELDVQRAGDPIVVMPKEEFNRLHAANERACKLLELRRSKIMKEAA